MLVNATQQEAHAEVLKHINRKAREYLLVFDADYSTHFDVNVQRDRLNNAIEELQILNELMNHTSDESPELTTAIEEWLTSNADLNHTVENIIYHTETTVD